MKNLYLISTGGLGQFHVIANDPTEAEQSVKNCNILCVSNLLCGFFEPKNDSSSATICKHCGREKWMHHPKAT